MTANLRAGGHTVTNPAELNPYGGTWNDCMRRDIAALMNCDTVATLPGWEHSKGARLEVLIAEHLGMTVVSARICSTSKLNANPSSNSQWQQRTRTNKKR
jgi:hypothetical protein